MLRARGSWLRRTGFAAVAIATSVVISPSDSLAQACVGNLPASSGQTCRESLRVNVGSFTQPGSGYSGTQFDIERNVRSSGQAWTQYASSRRGFDYLGTSTATGCLSGSQHLVTAAVGDCSPASGCDCILPQDYDGRCNVGRSVPCAGSSRWVIINVHPNVATMQSSTMLSAGYPGNLQHTILHELGHGLTDPNSNGGHVPPTSFSLPESDRQVMENGGFAAGGISFGSNDIAAVGAYVGTGIEYVQRLRTSSWPHPGTIPGWSMLDWLPSQWGSLDLTHGWVFGSLRRTSAFVVDTNNVLGLDIDQASGSFLAANGVTRRRVTTFYESEHGQWWLVGINQDDSIFVSRSADRVSWTSLGLLRRPSTVADPTPRIARTRFPVAIAYDAPSDRIVITYTNHSVFATVGCGAGPSGCAHELHSVALAWDATSAGVTGSAYTRWEDPGFPTQPSAAAVGAPAMACGAADGQGRNCEILYVSWTGDRAMGSVRFTVDAAGIWNRSLPIGNPGYTDDAISYESSSSGVMYSAVSGLNGNVWFASKIGVGGSGFAWYPAQSAPGVPIVSKKGPILRARPESSFDMVVFPY